MFLTTALLKKKSTVKEIAVYSDRNSGMVNNELPAKLYEFSNLEQLYLSADFKSLSPAIANLKQLNYLTISSGRIRVIPEGIGTLSKLESLTISGLRIDVLPSHLGNLKQLKNLTISYTNLKKLPDFINELTNLESLVVIDNPALTDISILAKGKLKKLNYLFIRNKLDDATLSPVFEIEGLETLKLGYNSLTEIPSTIERLQNLQILYLNYNNITEVPSVIAKLLLLEEIRLEGNQLEQFPTILKELPQLKKIGWTNNPLGKYCKELLEFPVEVINPYEKAAPKAKFAAFLDKIQACHFSPIQLDLFFDVQCNRMLPLGKYARVDFIALLRFDDRGFENSVIEKLVEYEQQKTTVHSIDKTSVVAILGKINAKKTSIKDALRKEGIGYSTKPTAEVTHLLVGSAIKDPAPLLDETYTLISEQAFQQYMNKWTAPYLLDRRNTGTLANLANLLLSPDSENQTLGVELLKGGGVPQELLSELFIVYKFCRNKKTAQKARKLLVNHASKNLLKSLKMRISLSSIKDRYLINGKIQKLTEGTEVEAWKVAQYAYQYDPLVWKEIVWLGLKDAPSNAAHSFLQKVVLDEVSMENGRFSVPPSLHPFLPLLYECCNFVEELSLHNIAEVPNGISKLTRLKTLNIYAHHGMIELPIDLGITPNLKSLQLYACQPNDWEPIFKLINSSPLLNKLNLNRSMLGGLAPNITSLKNIETLELVGRRMGAKDLKLLAKMPKLRSLICKDIPGHLSDDFLVLKNIEELSFEQGNQYSYNISPNIYRMSNLKALTIIGPAKIPNELNLITSLETLRIDFTYRRLNALQPYQVDQLIHLKKLMVRGEFDHFQKVIPIFKKLEYLELSFGQYNTDLLLDLLAKLPNLKVFKRYLNTTELLQFQSRFPQIQFIP
jgi:Leucine-rich repeat (LRR) protein